MIPNYAVRNRYMSHEGFALAARFGHDVMAAGPQYQPSEVGDKAYVTLACTPGTTGALCAVALQAAEHIQKVGEAYARPGAVGIRQEDFDDDNLFRYRGGLGDVEFTLYFGAAVAGSIVQQMVHEEVITQEAFDTMALGDWADMVRSDWFRTTMHTLTKARPGQHGVHGNRSGDFVSRRSLGMQWGLSKDMQGSEFVFTSYTDAEGFTSVAAHLNPAVEAILRQRMAERKTLGCPVARHQGTLPAALVHENPHARHLIAEGHLAVTGLITSRGTDYVRYTQEYTPIDRGLFVLADSLEAYSAQFGRPALNDHTVTHVADERTYPLRVAAPLLNVKR